MGPCNAEARRGASKPPRRPMGGGIQARGIEFPANWAVARGIRFGRTFLPKKCDTNHIPRATAYCPRRERSRRGPRRDAIDACTGCYAPAARAPLRAEGVLIPQICSAGRRRRRRRKTRKRYRPPNARTWHRHTATPLCALNTLSPSEFARPPADAMP